VLTLSGIKDYRKLQKHMVSTTLLTPLSPHQSSAGHWTMVSMGGFAAFRMKKILGHEPPGRNI